MTAFTKGLSAPSEPDDPPLLLDLHKQILLNVIEGDADRGGAEQDLGAAAQVLAGEEGAQRQPLKRLRVDQRAWQWVMECLSCGERMSPTQGLRAEIMAKSRARTVLAKRDWNILGHYDSTLKIVRDGGETVLHLVEADGDKKRREPVVGSDARGDADDNRNSKHSDLENYRMGGILRILSPRSTAGDSVEVISIMPSPISGSIWEGAEGSIGKGQKVVHALQ